MKLSYKGRLKKLYNIICMPELLSAYVSTDFSSL